MIRASSQPARVEPAWPPLRRHGLVAVAEAGWAQLRARPWDDEAAACLAHWAAHRLPLVVARQPPVSAEPEACDQTVSLGLPAPLQWSRRRIALQLPRSLLHADATAFPTMAAVVPLLAPQAAPAWHALQRDLDRLGCTARVYGSHGWQTLTGLPYLHPTSDLDLLLPVADAQAADAVVRCLAQAGGATPRLDGELVFSHGAAVAWREWQAWRAGAAAGVLVKGLRGARLEHGTGWVTGDANADVDGGAACRATASATASIRTRATTPFTTAQATPAPAGTAP